MTTARVLGNYGGSDRGTVVTKAQFQQLLDEMSHLREGQEDASLKLLQSRCDLYLFKTCGNKSQFCSCEKVALCLTTAQNSISQAKQGGGKQAFERVKTAIQEGRQQTKVNKVCRLLGVWMGSS